MFWDGNRWVDESPAPPRATKTGSHNALVAWIATGVMVAMGVLIALPLHQADADAVSLTLSPSEGTAGTGVAIQATGIPAGTAVVLQWDGVDLQVARVAGKSGKLKTRFTVPDDSVGPHQIALVTTESPQKQNGNSSRPSASQRVLAHGIVLASVAFALLPALPPAPAETSSVAVTPTPVAGGTSAPQTATPTVASTPTSAPTAAPATPTAAPTTRPPTPAPTAPSTPVPTPAPAAGCTVTFGGNASGTTDVTSALQTFLRQAPSGATACMAPNGQYLVNGTVQLSGRDNGITIDGNGARWFATARRNNAMLRFDGGGRNIVVRNLTIEGYNPNGRTGNAHDYSWEFGMGISLYGVVNATVTNVRILNVNGDGIYVSGGGTSSGFRWTDGISIRNVLIDGTGRHGVAFTDGVRNVTVSGSTVRYTGMYAFDLEPDGTAGAEGITITGNAISHYTIDSSWGPYLFAATGNANENNLEFSNNVVYGQKLRVAVQPNGYARTNIRILNNRSDTRVAGPAMEFAGCSGLTVTGNVQPLSSGELATVSGCSNVNISNNNTN
jgi:hypothetical protein